MITNMHPSRNKRPGCAVTMSAIFANISGAVLLISPPSGIKGVGAGVDVAEAADLTLSAVVWFT